MNPPWLLPSSLHRFFLKRHVLFGPGQRVSIQVRIRTADPRIQCGQGLDHFHGSKAESITASVRHRDAHAGENGPPRNLDLVCRPAPGYKFLSLRRRAILARFFCRPLAWISENFLSKDFLCGSDARSSASEWLYPAPGTGRCSSRTMSFNAGNLAYARKNPLEIIGMLPSLLHDND